MNTAYASLATRTFRYGISALVVTVAALQAQATTLPSISVVSGAQQSATYASAFTKPLVVKVLNPTTKAGFAGQQVNFLPGTGIHVSAPSVFTDVNGLATVTISGSAAGTFTVAAELAATPTVKATFASLVVKKAPLAILPYSLESKIGVIPAFKGYTLSGFVNGESAASAAITGTPLFTSIAKTTSVAGNYAITGTVGSLSAANYSFVPGKGSLTLVGVPICGNLGLPVSAQLTGTYAFNLFNQQGGFSGVLTSDGVSKLTGEMLNNTAILETPGEWSFSGNYRIGNGYRGGAVLLGTSSVNSTISQITTFCFAVDTIASGVATSGRIVRADGYDVAAAGTFYRMDNSATSNASFNGTYILGLQGTKMDMNTAKPLQYAQVAALSFDGSGNIAGSLSDTDYMKSTGEQYAAKQTIAGTYTYDPSQLGGRISLNNGTNLAFIAATSQHMIIVSENGGVAPDGITTSPVYFGEAQKQSAGPFSAASFTGNTSFVAQGVDMTSASPELVAEVGSITLDGVGTMTHQGGFAVLDGVNASFTPSTSGYSYTVDAATGRFESLDPTTHACNLCGYLVAPDTLIALAPGSGLPLFATLKTASAAPATLKLSTLKGVFSVGSMALVSPASTPYEGVITFDGKGNFSAATDTYTIAYGLFCNLKVAGKYAVSNGAYTLTLTGSKSPDFYLYLNSNDSGTIVPYSKAEASWIPLLTLNAVNP